SAAISPDEPRRIHRDPECGVYSRRRDPKRTRNAFAPLPPTPPPRSARKKGVLISEHASTGFPVFRGGGRPRRFGPPCATATLRIILAEPAWRSLWPATPRKSASLVTV